MQNTRLERRPPSSGGGFSRLVEGPAAWLITFVVIPGLLVVALLLPPINLLDRLQALTYTRIPASGGAIADPDGTLVSFPDEGVDEGFSATIASVPRVDFLNGEAGNELYEAAKNLPNNLVPKSPLYQVETRGTEPRLTLLDVPIPTDSGDYETLGIYAWDGAAWQHLPGSVVVTGNPNDDSLESRLDYVPTNFMVMQNTGGVPSATVDLGMLPQLPEGAQVNYEAKAGLLLRGDGALDGVAPANPNGTTVAIVRNWEPNSPPRTDLINNLLIDPGQQDNQVASVVGTVTGNGYPGVIIDYRGVDAVPSARADFAHLITRLAGELHQNGKTLGVRVEAPTQISAEEWDTKGYDWRALSEVVDTLIIPAPIDPRAYQAGGDVEALLKYAVSEVDPQKVQVELPGQSVERSGNYLLLKGYQEALRPLAAQVATAANGDQMSVSLTNPRLKEKVTWDEAVGMYRYSYLDDQSLERTVYIEDAGSLANKLRLLKKYNVKNVNLQVPASGDVDPAIWDTLLKFQQEQELPESRTQLNVAYSVVGADGAVLKQEVRPLEDPGFALAMPAGNVRIAAQLATAAGTLIPVSASADWAGAQGPEAKTAPDTGTEATGTLADVGVTTSQIVNVREGPGTLYPVVGQLAPANTYRVTGKNDVGDWWQIDIGDDKKGWVIGQLVNTAGDTNAVAVATDIPEVPAVAEQLMPAQAAPAEAAPAEAAPAEVPASAPVVSAPPPGGAIPFGYGVQAHMVDTSDDMIAQVMGSVRGLGFNWVKQQVEWKRFEAAQGARDWGALDPIINAANGANISVLFSVVNAPGWAREGGFDGSVGGPPADPQTYADFVGALAGNYCGTSLKAIEVWNEQNLHYEWGNKPLNPGEYVNLLARAYAAIKAACPSMYVISGALTPAGNNPPYAMDDFTYLEEMFKAGANSYLDAVGSHPSGYNVPPSSGWDGACAAIQVSGNSFNGACDSPHHSWSFRSTMEGYRNIMNTYGGGDKSIVPTEFGWAAGGAYHPSYKYADDNSLEEQAAWTVEAYQMMKSWGWVGPAILWNLNFRVVANGSEKAQWGIVGPDWAPLPVYNALAGMPK
jgi:hypothetical protein